MIYILNVYSQKYKCNNTPIKGNDYIKVIGEFETEEIDQTTFEAIKIKSISGLEFNGITDFSGYILTDEKGEVVDFAEDPAIDEELVTQLAIAEVYEKQIKQDEEILTTQLAVAEIFELLG